MEQRAALLFLGNVEVEEAAIKHVQGSACHMSCLMFKVLLWIEQGRDGQKVNCGPLMDH